MGFVWQNNARNLVPYLTAFQNIQLPMYFADSRKRRERAQELLELVGLCAKKNHRLDQLSGGEQQRIAIAIALANNPKILLADEPTGSVDPKTGTYILDVFRELNSAGLTVVIVTHDRMLSKRVNRVVSIRDGKTSSEMVVKQSFADRLNSTEVFEQAHNEYAVLDKVGRVQIPRELLEQIGVKGNKVSMEVVDGRIMIGAPTEDA